MILAGCGASADDGDADASAEGSLIEGPDPTITPPPTPTIRPTVAPTPIAEPATAPTATPEPGPEVEVIEAWERYLRLSIEARGKDPSPEALDFDSYVGGLAKDALVQVIADDMAAGDYVVGSITSISPSSSERADGAIIIEDCAEVDAERRSLMDDRLVESEKQTIRMRGRLDDADVGLIVEGFELGGPCLD